MQILRTVLEHQTILGALIVLVAVRLVTVIVFGNVLRYLSSDRNAIRCLLRKGDGDDCSEKN